VGEDIVKPWLFGNVRDVTQEEVDGMPLVSGLTGKHADIPQRLCIGSQSEDLDLQCEGFGILLTETVTPGGKAKEVVMIALAKAFAD
jgi:hypothetical protein